MQLIVQKNKNKQGRIPHIRTEYNGRVYASKKEAGYASHLEYLKHQKDPAKRVCIIETQVPYRILIKNKLVFTYFLDFYVRYCDGREEFIDVKSTHTAKDPVYRIKKKCVEAQYDLVIKEVVV